MGRGNDSDGARAVAARGSGNAGATIAFAVTWAVLLIAGRSGLLRDPGLFWHVLTGDRIFAQGFPRTDWLSFSFGGQPWIAHQWLGECIMSVLHRAAGFDGLVLATSGALALLFALLFTRLASAGVSTLWAAFVVALALAGCSYHFHVRPHVVSFLLFAWVYARLADVDAGRRSLRALWPLPLAFLVWVNVHGAALGGLATLALFVACWVAALALGWRSPLRGRRDVLAASALALACAATIPVTPYGLGIARAWVSILASPGLPDLIMEHMTPARTATWQTLGIAALYLAALMGAPRTALRASTLVPIAWLVMAAERVRHGPFFAVAAAIALCELLPQARWTAWLAARGFRVRGVPAGPPGTGFPLVASAAILLSVGGAAAVAQAAPQDSPLVARLDPARWPVELVPALRGVARELPKGAAILNEHEFGGFVSYEVPRLRIFMDDRWELYGDAFMYEFVRAEPAWIDAWVERSDARVALVKQGSALQRHLASDARWRLEARCRSGVLYVRDRGIGTATISARQPPATAAP